MGKGTFIRAAELDLNEKRGNLFINDDRVWFLARLGSGCWLEVEYIPGNVVEFSMNTTDESDDEVVARLNEVFANGHTAWYARHSHDFDVTTDHDEFVQTVAIRE